MLASELFESPFICPVCGCTPCNCTHVVKESDPCWKGYKQIGMKDKDGKKVPNCVPKKK